MGSDRARPASGRAAVKDEVAAFYDELAELYRLAFADWNASVGRQASVLATIMRERWSPVSRLLDAACGIGTQALGLAELGFVVEASDIARGALDRARREAAT